MESNEKVRDRITDRRRNLGIPEIRRKDTVFIYATNYKA
jgi:hypothetical protein